MEELMSKVDKFESKKLMSFTYSVKIKKSFILLIYAVILTLSSLYVCMAIKYIIVLFVETPCKFITAKLSIRKPGSSSVLIICDLFNSHALFIYKSVVICWLAAFKI